MSLRNLLPAYLFLRVDDSVERSAVADVGLPPLPPAPPRGEGSLVEWVPVVGKTLWVLPPAHGDRAVGGHPGLEVHSPEAAGRQGGALSGGPLAPPGDPDHVLVIWSRALTYCILTQVDTRSALLEKQFDSSGQQIN